MAIAFYTVAELLADLTPNVKQGEEITPGEPMYVMNEVNGGLVYCGKFSHFSDKDLRKTTVYVSMGHQTEPVCKLSAKTYLRMDNIKLINKKL